MSDSTAVGASLPSSSRRCVNLSCLSRQHVVRGVALALGAAVCWAGTVISVRRSLRAPAFYAPFFMTYFSTSFMLLVYPVYVVCRLVAARCKVSLRELIRSVSIQPYIRSSDSSGLTLQPLSGLPMWFLSNNPPQPLSDPPRGPH